MKIGEFSQKYHIPIATVRHYINLGLLVPEKDGFQYNFTDNDCDEMEIISYMKSAGFKLNECRKYLSMLRFYNKEDYLIYERLIDFLNSKKRDLYQERNQINSYIKLINQKIDEIKADSAAILEKESSSVSTNLSPQELSGFPLNTVDMLRCPRCHGKIKLSNVDISGSAIMNGILSCSCGYHASIKGGIMYTEDFIDPERDSQFLEWYFGEENLEINEDLMFLITMADRSEQYLTNMHKSSRWIHSELSHFDLRGKTVLFPDVSVQYLYNHYASAYLQDCTIIITAFTERTICAMRHHMANVNPNLKTTYIINQNGRLPLELGCIDVVIDYLGSCNLGFFTKEQYFDSISPYLAKDAVAVGVLEYYRNKPNPSLTAIHAHYPNSAPKVMTESFVMDALARNGFALEKHELIAEGYEPGNFFEYHVPGDIRCDSVYLALRRAVGNK